MRLLNLRINFFYFFYCVLLSSSWLFWGVFDKSLQWKKKLILKLFKINIIDTIFFYLLYILTNKQLKLHDVYTYKLSLNIMCLWCMSGEYIMPTKYWLVDNMAYQPLLCYLKPKLVSFLKAVKWFQVTNDNNHF